MSEKHALAVPPAAKRDPKSFEILRVWVADQDQHVSLSATAWEDPFAWGIVLADLARHIVNATKLNDHTINEAAFLQRILDGFDAEMETPTDEVDGQLQ